VPVLSPAARVRRRQPYRPPLAGRTGLRLDFNENTVGCSPRVLAALGGLSAAALTRYPERAPVEAALARHFGLAPEQVLLTNGLDEAIQTVCHTYLDKGAELLLPVPTYAMYEVYAAATPAGIRRIAPAPGFAFPLRRLLAAVRPATRLIAIANPNSPTGQAATRAELVRVLEAAPHAAVLVDEAYFHFHGETVLDLVGRVPNLIVARTFSKAYGLAGLRVGWLAAAAAQMTWLRRGISPYSVNAAALAAAGAVLEDEAFLHAYVTEVLAARELFEAGLRRLGLAFWPSQANFVLVNAGARHASVVNGLRARGILVRDRSSDPGCAGCARITLGTRAQARRTLAALTGLLS